MKPTNRFFWNFLILSVVATAAWVIPEDTQLSRFLLPALAMLNLFAAFDSA